ncbi:MAG: hemolysin family protein [Schleiferiaceae bacterium]|nr:hemolysin family protein [Schleiferiaceae bacterium]
MAFILPIVLAVFFSALFSGLEMAYLSINKLHVELERQKGGIAYKALGYLVDRPAPFIAAILVGNNVALVLYGNYMHRVLTPVFTSWGAMEYLILLLETSVSTVVILVFAEFLPKTLFRQNPEGLMRWLSLPAWILFWVLRLPSALMLGVSQFFLKYVFRVEVQEEENAFGRMELDHYVRERAPKTTSGNEEVDPEFEIFKNALEFPETKAREFMIPRTEIESVEGNELPEKVRAYFIETGYSKLLVYEDNIDKIIGYVHAFELFKKPDHLRRVLRPVAFIPESMRADEVLNLFTREKRNIAVVLDEHGGTSGMITLEDVIEEIFGEIEDEHDTDELLERQIKEGEWLFSARLDISDINERWGLGLPQNENYNTLGGYILDLYQSLPEKGTVVRSDQYLFLVQKTRTNRLEEVLVKAN